MRTVTLSSLCTLSLLLVAGCSQQQSPSNEENSNREQAPQKVQVAQIGGGPGVGGVLSAVDRPRVLNDLKQIATFYATYRAEYGKAPQSEKAFAEYIKRDANKLYAQIIKDKKYVIVPNAGTESDCIVAYHKAPERSGSYAVARADGSSALVDGAEFKKQVK